MNSLAHVTGPGEKCLMCKIFNDLIRMLPFHQLAASGSVFIVDVGSFPIAEKKSSLGSQYKTLNISRGVKVGR